MDSVLDFLLDLVLGMAWEWYCEGNSRARRLEKLKDVRARRAPVLRKRAYRMLSSN
jgi:hypothetical protein